LRDQGRHRKKTVEGPEKASVNMERREIRANCFLNTPLSAAMKHWRAEVFVEASGQCPLKFSPEISWK
jgi:hypothetical protein